MRNSYGFQSKNKTKLKAQSSLSTGDRSIIKYLLESGGPQDGRISIHILYHNMEPFKIYDLISEICFSHCFYGKPAPRLDYLEFL